MVSVLNLGHLEIEQKEKKDDPILIRKEKSTENLTVDQKYLLNRILFKGNTTFVLSAGSKTKASILKEGFGESNNKLYTWSVADGYMAENPQRI